MRNVMMLPGFCGGIRSSRPPISLRRGRWRFEDVKGGMMEPQADAFVDIAENQIGYFGGPGKMLLPSLATVGALVAKIPAHKLLTTDLLRKKLAGQSTFRAHAL